MSHYASETERMTDEAEKVRETTKWKPVLTAQASIEPLGYGAITKTEHLEEVTVEGCVECISDLVFAGLL